MQLDQAHRKPIDEKQRDKHQNYLQTHHPVVLRDWHFRWELSLDAIQQVHTIQRR